MPLINIIFTIYQHPAIRSTISNMYNPIRVCRAFIQNRTGGYALPSFYISLSISKA